MISSLLLKNHTIIKWIQWDIKRIQRMNRSSQWINISSLPYNPWDLNDEWLNSSWFMSLRESMGKLNERSTSWSREIEDLNIHLCQSRINLGMLNKDCSRLASSAMNHLMNILKLTFLDKTQFEVIAWKYEVRWLDRSECNERIH